MKRSISLSSIFILCSLSLLCFALSRFIPQTKENIYLPEMIRASEKMMEAIQAIRECQREKGVLIDEKTDINRTGLIGSEFSPITTSLGNLEAKRTTTNPNLPALLSIF